MIIDDNIRDEKLQYEINREAAEISALSSGKIDKYEYLTGEETLPSNQRQHTETIEGQGKKQIDAITNQSKRLGALTKKDDDHKDNFKKIFEELV